MGVHFPIAPAVSFGGMRSARSIGLVMLAIPLTTALALPFFPSYDARAPYFAGSYHSIVEAGNDYLVALVLFLVMAGLVVTLAVGLSRSPLRSEASAMLLVVGGLGLAAFGFATAGLTGIPVWNWAGQVADGSETLAVMAARSENLAGISQTVLLMFGFGGLLVATSVLGVVAVVRGWTPKVVFVATVGVAGGVVAVGVVTSGPVFWLILGALPLLWWLAFGLVLTVRGRFGSLDPDSTA